MKKLKTSFSKISVALVSMTILATGLWACSSDDTATSNNTTTENTSVEKTITAKAGVSVESLENIIKTQAMVLKGEGIDINNIGEERANKFIEPIVVETRNLLISEGISESEIIEAFGAIDAPEIALAGISIVEYEKKLSSNPAVLECVTRAFVGFDLHDGFWSNFTNRRTLIRAVGKMATRYLGVIGAALIVYDFADCMWGNG